MAHPPPPSTLWQRLTGKPTNARPAASALGAAARERVRSATPYAEMWGLGQDERKPEQPETIAWESPLPLGKSTPAAPVSGNASRIPVSLLDQVRILVAEQAHIILPMPVVMKIMDGALGQRLMDQGAMDPYLASDIKDALGRHMVGQEWPHPKDTERQRPYQIGIQISAKLLGYEILPA